MSTFLINPLGLFAFVYLTVPERFGSPREEGREQRVFSGAGPGPCSPRKSCKSLFTESRTNQIFLRYICGSQLIRASVRLVLVGPRIMTRLRSYSVRVDKPKTSRVAWGGQIRDEMARLSRASCIPN